MDSTSLTDLFSCLIYHSIKRSQDGLFCAVVVRFQTASTIGKARDCDEDPPTLDFRGLLPNNGTLFAASSQRALFQPLAGWSD